MRMIILSAAIALLAAPAPAQVAPLPPHWTLQSEEEDEEAQPEPQTLAGIYGRGVSSPRGELEADWETRPHRLALCRGDIAAQRAWFERLPDHDVEFWFYGTANQSVIFTRSVNMPSASACSEPPTYRYSYERGFVVDGFYHQIAGPESLSGAYTRRVGDRLRYAYAAFSELYGMTTRLWPNREGSYDDEVVAGLPARCFSRGFGFVSQSTCLSLAGPSRGLPLSTSSGDDSQELASTRFLEVVPNARLDPRLFDFGRSWTDRDAARR